MRNELRLELASLTVEVERNTVLLGGELYDQSELRVP